MISLCIKFNWQITFGELLTITITLISVGIAVWQFRVQFKDLKESREKAQRETWFLNVIVLPHMDGLNGFYNNLIEKLSNEVAALKSAVNKSTSAKTIIKRKAQLTQNIQKDIDHFYEHFCALVNSYDKIRGNQLREMTRDLEDLCAKMISDYNDIEQSKIHADIQEHKQNVLSHLHSIMRG